MPQAERDDWLLQLTQELLDAARDRVDLVFRQSEMKGDTLIQLGVNCFFEEEKMRCHAILTFELFRIKVVNG